MGTLGASGSYSSGFLAIDATPKLTELCLNSGLYRTKTLSSKEASGSLEVGSGDPVATPGTDPTTDAIPQWNIE